MSAAKRRSNALYLEYQKQRDINYRILDENKALELEVSGLKKDIARLTDLVKVCELLLTPVLEKEFKSGQIWESKLSGGQVLIGTILPEKELVAMWTNTGVVARIGDEKPSDHPNYVLVGE